jgi:hypothetical protein
MNKNVVTDIIFLDVAFEPSTKPIWKIIFVMVLHIIVAKNMKQINGYK